MSRFRHNHGEPDQVVWSELPPVYWKAFGIALLLGFMTGLGWIGWKVFEAYVAK
jgi:hypothetical protein